MRVTSWTAPYSMVFIKTNFWRSMQHLNIFYLSNSEKCSNNKNTQIFLLVCLYAQCVCLMKGTIKSFLISLWNYIFGKGTIFWSRGPAKLLVVWIWCCCEIIIAFTRRPLSEANCSIHITLITPNFEVRPRSRECIINFYRFIYLGKIKRTWKLFFCTDI